MTYYYIHVVKGRGGGDSRFSLLFHCSELATPNQSDLKECGDVCACARWRALYVGKCFSFLTCLYHICVSLFLEVWNGSVTLHLCVWCASDEICGVFFVIFSFNFFRPLLR